MAANAPPPFGGMTSTAATNSETTNFRVEQMDEVPLEQLAAAKQLSAAMQQYSDANQLYQKCFQLLKLGGLSAEIPRLVVFGQQSMGKTTLLVKGKGVTNSS